MYQVRSQVVLSQGFAKEGAVSRGGTAFCCQLGFGGHVRQSCLQKTGDRRLNTGGENGFRSGFLRKEFAVLGRETDVQMGVFTFTYCDMANTGWLVLIKIVKKQEWGPGK